MIKAKKIFNSNNIIIFILLLFITTPFLYQLWHSNIQNIDLGFEKIFLALKNTLYYGIISVIGVNILYTFELLSVSIYKIRGYKFYNNAFKVVFIFFGITMLLTYNILFSTSGYITIFISSIFPQFNKSWFIGDFAINSINIFTLVIFHHIIITNKLQKLDQNIIDYMKVMKVPNYKIILTIIKYLKSSYLLASLLVFLGSAGNLLLIEYFGLKNSYIIKNLLVTLFNLQKYEMVIVLGSLLGIISFIVTLLYYYISKNDFTNINVTEPFRGLSTNSKFLKFIFQLFSILISVIYIVPILILILLAFKENPFLIDLNSWVFTLKNFSVFMSNKVLIYSLINTVIFALISTSIASIASFFIALNLHYNKNKISTKLVVLLLASIWFIPSIMYSINYYLFPLFKTHLQIADKSIISIIIMYVISLLFIFSYTLYNIINTFPENVYSYCKVTKLNSNIVNKKMLFPYAIKAFRYVFLFQFTRLIVEYDIALILYDNKFTPVSVYLNSLLSSPDVNKYSYIIILILIIVFINFLVSLLISKRDINIKI